MVHATNRKTVKAVKANVRMWLTTDMDPAQVIIPEKDDSRWKLRLKVENNAFSSRIHACKNGQS